MNSENKGMALITAENAREMAAKGNAAKAARLQQLRDAVQDAVSNPVIAFPSRTLSRVRLQMGNLADEIDKAIGGDSKRLKELTDAFTRLAELERQLDNRPLPGSRRPKEDRPKRNEPLPEPTPAPVSAYNPANDPLAPNG